MSTQPTYLIAEDEPLLAQELARCLAEQWPQAKCLGLLANGEDALTQWTAQRSDVVFLDVRMPVRDGLATAQALSGRPDPPLIVFVTAYDAYAVAAFDAEAIDYLLKPVETERLARCVERLRQRLQSGAEDSARQLAQRITALLQGDRSSAQRLKFVRAGAGRGVRLIPIEEVLWFDAQDKYITVATVQGDSVIRMPLRELIEQLDPEVFWRVHRGTVVNSRFVTAAKRDELGHLSLSLRGRSETLPVSRQFAHLFRQM